MCSVVCIGIVEPTILTFIHDLSSRPLSVLFSVLSDILLFSRGGVSHVYGVSLYRCRGFYTWFSSECPITIRNYNTGPLRFSSSEHWTSDISEEVLIYDQFCSFPRFAVIILLDFGIKVHINNIVNWERNYGNIWLATRLSMCNLLPGHSNCTENNELSSVKQATVFFFIWVW